MRGGLTRCRVSCTGDSNGISESHNPSQGYLALPLLFISTANFQFDLSFRTADLQSSTNAGSPLEYRPYLIYIVELHVIALAMESRLVQQ